MDDITIIRLASLLEEKSNWFQSKADIVNPDHEAIKGILEQLADYFRESARIIRGDKY